MRVKAIGSSARSRSASWRSQRPAAAAAARDRHGARHGLATRPPRKRPPRKKTTNRADETTTDETETEDRGEWDADDGARPLVHQLGRTAANSSAWPATSPRRSRGRATPTSRKAADAMQKFADEAPEDIQDDFQTLADAYSKIADALDGVDLSSGDTPSRRGSRQAGPALAGDRLHQALRSRSEHLRLDAGELHQRLTPRA